LFYNDKKLLTLTLFQRERVRVRGFRTAPTWNIFTESIVDLI
jgi:hypothetical protein